MEEEPKPTHRRWRRWGLALLAFVTLHLLVDGLHAVYVAAAIDAWKDTIEIDAAGVLAGCDAYDFPPAGEGEAGGAVLFVHGFNASPRHWDLVAPAVGELGVQCRVMRLPGFVEPGALRKDHEASDWVAAVSTELATLRAKHDRVGVVGHSLGGAVTTRVLIDDPDAADYAVLVAPAVAVSNARAPVLSTRAWHEISQRTLVFTKVLKSPFPMDCRTPGRTDWPGRMPFTSTEVVDELFGLLDRNAPDAERFTTPVTVLLSATDRVVDTEAAAAYYERLGSPDKQKIVFDQSGHAVPLDSEWDRVVEAVTARAL